MGIVVIGAAFADIKGFPQEHYIPTGRNAGRIEYVHGGVARNVTEDIANVELRPTYVGIVDDTPLGADVLHKLQKHKVNTEYVLTLPDGMGTWLAIFNEQGDVVGSISKRPNMLPLVQLLKEQGESIFSHAHSVVIEADLDKEIVKLALELAHSHKIKIFGVVSNMSIAVERRDLLQQFDCFICNSQEAGILFLEDYTGLSPEAVEQEISRRIQNANIPAMVVTLGPQGAVYGDYLGRHGFCPARPVRVRDTTGAGDAFCAGVAIGLTYGKSLREAVEIGSILASSVITSSENVCPRFLPRELGLDILETV